MGRWGCPVRHKHHSPPRDNKDYTRSPRVTDASMDPMWLPFHINMQESYLHAIPEASMKCLALEKVKRQGWQKKDCKGRKHGFCEVWDTGGRDGIYFSLCRENNAWSFP